MTKSNRFAVLIFVSIISITFFATTKACLAEDAPAPAQKIQKKDIKDRVKKPVTIESDTLEADNAKGVVVFRGNVVAEEEFILCSDELTVTYDGEKKRDVREIIAVGAVRIYQAGKVATAGRALYNRQTGAVVLTGKPRIKQCGNEVAGERITLNVDDETAQVEASTGGRVRAVIMPDEPCDKAAKAGEAKVDKEDFCRRTR